MSEASAPELREPATWLDALEDVQVPAWREHARGCAAADCEGLRRPADLPQPPSAKDVRRLYAVASDAARGQRERRRALALWRLTALATVENDEAVATARRRRTMAVAAERNRVASELGWNNALALFHALHADQPIDSSAKALPRLRPRLAEVLRAKMTDRHPRERHVHSPLAWAHALLTGCGIALPRSASVPGALAVTHLCAPPHEIVSVLPSAAWAPPAAPGMIRVVLHELGHVLAAEAVDPSASWLTAQTGSRLAAETIAETVATLADVYFDTASRIRLRAAWRRWQVLRCAFEVAAYRGTIATNAACRAYWTESVNTRDASDEPMGDSPCPLDEAWFFEDPGTQSVYLHAADAARDLVADLIDDAGAGFARVMSASAPGSAWTR